MLRACILHLLEGAGKSKRQLDELKAWVSKLRCARRPVTMTRALDEALDEVLSGLPPEDAA
jgi:hypothetical protein